MTGLEAARAAREYIASAGWPDISAIEATAREGVAEEDVQAIRDHYADDEAAAGQVIAAVRDYCRAVVAGDL